MGDSHVSTSFHFGLSREYGINQVLISTQNHLFNNYPYSLGRKSDSFRVMGIPVLYGNTGGINKKKARINDSGFRFKGQLNYAATSFLLDGLNLVKSMPCTAASYSAIVGVRPRIVDNTTTGVDESNDSPFFSPESLTTLP